MTFKSAIQRAAILVKSLPQTQAAKLLSHLDSVELQKVSREIRELNQVADEDLKLAQQNFVAQFEMTVRSGSLCKNKVVGQPFDFLNPVSGDLRFELLCNEHPAVVATVITYLSTPAASDLINRYEPVERVSILRRLCKSEIMTSEKTESLSARLQNRLSQTLLSIQEQRSGVEVASRLLSCFEPHVRENYLEELEAGDADLAAKVCENIFTFDDIVTLSDSNIRQILLWVDTSFWAPALVHADVGMRRKIFNNMAERPRLILNREIETIENVDFAIANHAQAKIVESILELEEKKAIDLNRCRSDQSNTRRAA